MRPPPSLTRAYQFPLTTGISLLAIAVTAAWASHYDISPLFADPLYLLSQPWRLVTSALPHGSIFHIAFNLYWFWVFGTFVEKHLGLTRYFVILVLLAAGSGAAELAIFRGGIGLSGVVYGLFGMLWMMGCRNRAFADLVDARTSMLFIIWFFLCIFLTAFNILQVANVAHAVGLLLGLLIGELVLDPRHRVGTSIALAMSLVLIALAATVARPWVNFDDGGAPFASGSYQALIHNDFARAAALGEQATRYRRATPGSWLNLGIAYQQLDRRDDALAAYRHAAALDPNNADIQTAIHALSPGAPPAPPAAASETQRSPG